MLKFSIRDVILLTLVVAMGLGWWANHRAMQAENELLREQVQKLQFLTVGGLDSPEVKGVEGTHQTPERIRPQTLEWIPPVGN